MKKIITTLAIISIFLGFSPNAFAVQDFDYFFGTLLVPAQRAINSVPLTVPVSNNVAISNPNSAQILSMQANLNQIKANFATLKSNLAKSNSFSGNAVKSSSEVVVARGIPLLLEEKTKEEKNQRSVFASLIPPDVRNFPILSTYLVILTLAIFGVIIYLYFVRKQAKSQSV